MKIMLVITNLKLGGAERVCSLIGNALASKGYQVSLVLMKNDKNSKRYHINESINIIDANANYLSFISKLYSIINKEKPDVIISFLTPINLIVTLLKSIGLIKSKIIIRETTIKSKSNENKPLIKKNFLNFFIKIFYRKADQIIAISKMSKEDLMKFYKLPSNKIKLINNPIDINSIVKLGAKKTNLKLVYPHTIICVASFVPSKGHEYLVNAIFLLNKQGFYTNLIFVGEGPLQDKIREQCNHLLEKKQVHFIKHTNNPFQYMSSADILILPSLWEGFGNVIIEAMALKTPVISTLNSGGPQDIIKNSYNGLLVPKKNSEALAGAIEKIIFNEEFRRSLINNGVHTAEKFHLEKIIRKYEEVIVEKGEI